MSRKPQPGQAFGIEVDSKGKTVTLSGDGASLEALGALLEEVGRRRTGKGSARVKGVTVRVVRRGDRKTQFPGMKGREVILTAPTGKEIVGTAELIPGTALASKFMVLGNGDVEAVYEGETEVDWDGQETKRQRGRVTLVDTEGCEWRVDEVSAAHAPGRNTE